MAPVSFGQLCKIYTDLLMTSLNILDVLLYFSILSLDWAKSHPKAPVAPMRCRLLLGWRPSL